MKVILTWILVPIPEINIYGAVIASIGAYVVSSLLNLLTMNFALKIKLKFYEILIKPSYASIFMIIFVLISYNILYSITTSNGVSCLISIFLGMILYILLIILFKVFKIEEIKDRLKRRS